MQSGANGAAHESMIGRMKLDLVDAAALAVVSLEPGRFNIGKTRKILCFGGPDKAAVLVELVANGFRHSLAKLHQQRIVTIGIATDQQRRLVFCFDTQYIFPGMPDGRVPFKS